MSQQDVQTIRESYVAFKHSIVTTSPTCSGASIHKSSFMSPVADVRRKARLRAPKRWRRRSSARCPTTSKTFVPTRTNSLMRDSTSWSSGDFAGEARVVTLDAPFVHVWTMRSGKASRFYNHVEQSAWTKAWRG
jgi:hypothetical protein